MQMYKCLFDFFICLKTLEATRHRLHIILHHAAATEPPSTARAIRALGSTHYGRAVFHSIRAGHRKLLRRLRRIQCPSADPELHHREYHGNQSREQHSYSDRRHRKKFLGDCRKHEQSHERPHSGYYHDCRHERIIITKIIGPGGCV